MSNTTNNSQPIDPKANQAEWVLSLTEPGKQELLMTYNTLDDCPMEGSGKGVGATCDIYNEHHLQTRNARVRLTSDVFRNNEGTPQAMVEFLRG